jgi:cell division protein FtsI (penicillin-binding protein 3)
LTKPTSPLLDLEQDPLCARIAEPGGIAKQALDLGRARLLAAGLVLTLAFIGVGLRLVDLALLDGGGGHTAVAATGRSLPHRADIVDRNGVLLATSVESASLYANPDRVLDPARAAHRLAGLLPDLDEAQIYAKLTSEEPFVWLQRDLSPRQEHQIIALGIPGIDFEREEKRVYPLGALTAHVVGYTNVDERGLAGVEASMDAVLKANPEPLELSLDVRFQYILTEELKAAMQAFDGIGAAGLVLDANTGEVVALVSLPSFHPTRPAQSSKDERFNRVTLGIYEMGSVFKLLTAAMALDTGTATMFDSYDASHPIHVASYTISDFHPKNRWLSVPEILIYSSNIGAARMALDVGGDAQRNFLDRLGLLGPTEIELPEVGAPLFPSKWRPINTMTIAYGHGIAVSPLHMANAVAALVNGGLRHQPTLLRQDPDFPPAGRRVVSEDTSRRMRQLMRLVVKYGTGKLANVDGYLVGGKTGTANKLHGRGYDLHARLASFVGAFPINDPRYVVLAMVDEPKGRKETHGYATGGWVAAPVVGRTIDRIAALIGLEPAAPAVAREDDSLLVNVSAKGRRLAFE